MTHEPHKHHRRSVRLKGYDYSQIGAYFVTICTRDRALLFNNGSIRNIVEQCLLEIPDHFPVVKLDEWVVMPNHLHAIVITTCRGVQLNAPTKDLAIRDPNNPFSLMSPHRNTISVIVRTFKAAVTTLSRRAGYDDFGWQRNYYEHVIRDEDELNLVRQYTLDNPVQWEMDENNPNRLGEPVCQLK